VAKKKLFTLSENKRTRRPKINKVRAAVIQDETDKPPFFVRGQQAGSKEEYWCSLALDKIQQITGWGWDYQVPVYGGRQIRGGNVVDFLIYTPGMWTILDPQGDYWHTGRNEDRFQMREVARKKGWRLIEWLTSTTPTKEDVYKLLKKELHV